MKPYFKLRPYKDSDGLQQIQLYYFNKGKQLILNSTVKTKQEYWDDSNQRITSRASEIKQKPAELNQTLTEKMIKLEKIVVDFQRIYNYAPTIEWVKEEFLKEGKKIVEAKEVKQEFKDWIKSKSTKVKFIKLYTTVLNDLTEFHPTGLYYRNLNLKFFDQFQDYLLNQNLQNSTVIKRLKTFRVFLNDKWKRGENEFDWFKKF